MKVTAEVARRFLVARHFLAPARSLAGGADAVLEIFRRLGSIQYDPLAVAGRNHDLVLHARVADYDPAWCDLLYERREVFEAYNKGLSFVPTSEYPWFRATLWREPRRVLAENADVAERVLERVRAAGPLSALDFERERGSTTDWFGIPTNTVRAVLEAYAVTGVLGLARRDGNRRYYDLIERLVPDELLALHESEEDAMTHRLLSRFRATGMTTPIGTQTEVMYSAGAQAERRQRTERLVEQGELLPIAVESLKGPRYIIAAEEPILEAVADPLSLPAASVSFLAPLDSLVWDRRMLRELWGFDYLWEVYVPEAKRRWGYYVLPILFGDRFVGRIEPRIDRKAKSLTILGIWFEPTFTPMEEPRFIAALGEAIEAYRSFVGAIKVVWPRTRPGRDVASALRRLAA